MPVGLSFLLQQILKQSRELYKLMNVFMIYFIILFFKILFTLRQRGGEKRIETSMCGCLSRAPLLGIWPTTQACALTGNQTSDPSACRPVLNPLSHTSQGLNYS